MAHRPGTEHQENEPDLKKVFDSLIERHREEKQKQSESGPEWLENRLASMPDRVKEELRALDKELREDGMTDPAKRAKHIDKRVVALEQTYQDQRFTIGNGEKMLRQEYAKEQAVGWVKEVLDNHPSPEDLKKIAFLSFDANGLKAVNDLSSSHEKGTEYLKRLAAVLHQPDDGTQGWMREQGVRVRIDVTAGGDEYGMMIRSDKPITQEVLDELSKRIQQQVQAIDVSDLVDFKDEGVRQRYLGISEKEFAAMSDEKKAEIRAQADKEIPADFKMRASISAGGATLYNGMLAAMRHPHKALSEEDNYSSAVYKIMGGMFDAADAKANQDKMNYKLGLKSAEAAPLDKFYSKVLARTTEARILEAKIDELQSAARDRQAFDADMRGLEKLLKDGIMSIGDYLKTKAEKEAAMRRAD
jgi:GGDEF domain-containing protein